MIPVFVFCKVNCFQQMQQSSFKISLKKKVNVHFPPLYCLVVYICGLDEARSDSIPKTPVLRLRIATTSIPVYVTIWCRHGFESHSQLFLLTYPEAELTYYF